MLIFAALLCMTTFGAEVTFIGSSGKFLVISQEVGAAFIVGEFVCVVEGQKETACGFVTVANRQAAIVALEREADEIEIGSTIAFAIETQPTKDFPKRTDGQDTAETADLYHAMFQEEVSEGLGDGLKRSSKYTYNFSAGTTLTNPNLQFESAFDEKLSFAIQIAMNNIAPSNLNTQSGVTGNMKGIIFGIQYYHRELFDGLWFRAGVGFYSGNLSHSGRTDDPGALGVLASVGHRWLKKHFNFGIFGGAQCISIRNTDSFPYDIKILSPLAGVDFGWAF